MMNIVRNMPFTFNYTLINNYIMSSRFLWGDSCEFLKLKHENIESAGTRVNNCKFAKDSSIRASLFKGKVQ